MPLPTSYSIQVDWNNDGDFSDAYEDISADVKEVSIERGRDSELGECSAGTLELRVINTDGKYSPQHAGPLYGNLKKGRPCRVRATYATVTYDLFYGYLERIVPNPDKQSQDAYIYATDLLARMGRTNIHTALLAGQTEAQILTTIKTACQKVGETIPTVFDSGLDTYSYAWFENDNALEAAQHMARSSLGLFYADGAGNLVFENRDHRNGAPHDAALATLSNDQFSMRYTYGERELVNKVTTTSHTREIGYSVELWRLGETRFIQAGDTWLVWAKYDDPANSVVTPVSGTDYEANNAADGSGANRTADVSIVMTTYAQSTKLEITNTGTTGFYLTLMRLRGTLLSEIDTNTSLVEDATSQLSYYLQIDDFDADFIDSADWAGQRCRHILTTKATPVAEIEMTLRPATAAILTQMLARTISDRVHIEETQTAVDEDFFIEKIRHRWAPGWHETDWVLLPASAQSVFWVLGSGILGTSTVLAY